jgi:predicted NUDIX family phosphoesterase
MSRSTITFRQAAHKVLKRYRRPMSAIEITERALQLGWLTSSGHTPHKSMGARLAEDILTRGPQSQFMRTDAGLFALRSHINSEFEYTARRFRKRPFDEDVLVFPAASIRRFVPKDGLSTHPFSSRELLGACRPRKRSEAEADWSSIQLVSFFIVRHRARILTYKRSRRLPERRLHGERSLGFGGHLNPDDVPPLLDIFQPSVGGIFLFRELDEELRLSQQERPKLCFRGLLYDSSRLVSRQHLGIVFDVNLRLPDYKIGERGLLIDPRFETPRQIAVHINEFENWSALIAEAELSNE